MALLALKVATLELDNDFFQENESVGVRLNHKEPNTDRKKSGSNHSSTDPEENLPHQSPNLSAGVGCQ